MKDFMVSVHFWNLWFGWAKDFGGKKNTFFGCKLTYNREFSVSIRLQDCRGAITRKPSKKGDSNAE